MFDETLIPMNEYELSTMSKFLKASRANGFPYNNPKAFIQLTGITNATMLADVARMKGWMFPNPNSPDFTHALSSLGEYEIDNMVNMLAIMKNQARIEKHMYWMTVIATVSGVFAFILSVLTIFITSS